MGNQTNKTFKSPANPNKQYLPLYSTVLFFFHSTPNPFILCAINQIYNANITAWNDILYSDCTLIVFCRLYSFILYSVVVGSIIHGEC